MTKKLDQILLWNTTSLDKQCQICCHRVGRLLIMHTWDNSLIGKVIAGELYSESILSIKQNYVSKQLIKYIT